MNKVVKKSSLLKIQTLAPAATDQSLLWHVRVLYHSAPDFLTSAWVKRGECGK